MKKRPDVLQGSTRRQPTGCGKSYVTINFDEQGNVMEVFFELGKSGGCAAAQNEAIGRLISWGCRSGADISDAIRSLKGITCPESDKHYSEEETSPKYACAHAIAIAIEKAMGIGPLEPFDEDKVH